MPRRMITSDIWFNLKVNKLPDAGRLLFIGIFSSADDDGRLRADPVFLRARIFPYDLDKTIEQILDLRNKCHELGLIRVYTNGHEEILDIPGWLEHQQIRKDRYKPSSLPSYDECQLIAGNQMATAGQPNGNQMATAGMHSIVKYSIVKYSISSMADIIIFFMKEIKNIKWTLELEQDIDWFASFCKEYPEINDQIITKFFDYYSGKPPAKHKGIWKNRLRNWMLKDREFKEKQQGAKGKKQYTSPEDYRRLHGGGIEEDKEWKD